MATHQVDAIFADVDTCPDLVQILRGQKTGPSVYLLCRQELPPEDTGGIRGIVTYPLTRQKLLTVLQPIPRENMEVV